MVESQRRRPSPLRRPQYRCFELSRLPEQVGQVALWRLRFDLSQEPDESAQALLSDEERERLRVFRKLDDRVRFVACRATLRTLLAERLGSAPRDVRVARGRHGKPKLLGTTLDFNLSHAHELGLFALVEHGEVGVDVERIESRQVAGLLAPHILHEDERLELESHSTEPWEERVFRRWVLKEAVLKACGVGLSVSPSSFKVTTTRGPEARFALADGPFPVPDRQVRIDLVGSAAGYAAALVHVQACAS